MLLLFPCPLCFCVWPSTNEDWGKSWSDLCDCGSLNMNGSITPCVEKKLNNVNSEDRISVFVILPSHWRSKLQPYVMFNPWCVWTGQWIRPNPWLMLTLLDYPNLSVTMAGGWSMSPGGHNSVSNSKNITIKWQQQVIVLNSAYKPHLYHSVSLTCPGHSCYLESIFSVSNDNDSCENDQFNYLMDF